MCQINPMSEIRAIAETCRRKCLPSNARLLWRVLFDCANDRQEWNPDSNTYNWPEDYFPICNDELKSNSALEKRALLEARNVLQEIGAIDFIPGENNRRPARYRIRYLTGQRNKYVPVHRTAAVPAHDPEDVPIYKDKDKEEYTEKDGVYDDDDDDDDDISVSSRARTRTYPRTRVPDPDPEDRDPVPDREERRAEIRRGFRSAIGRNPYPAELDQLVTESWSLDFPPVMVSMALSKAALYEPASPVNYAVEILLDWRKNHVRQPHQVEQYESDHKLETGKLGYWSSEAMDKCLKASRRKRYLENIYDGIDDDLPL